MRKLALPILIALLAGCASTTQVRQAVDNSPATNGVAPRYAVGEIVISAEDVPAHFDDMIRNYLEADLRERHIGPDDAEPDRKVNINVTSYRMRGSVTRFMLGAFAGKDGVDSSVEVINVATAMPSAARKSRATTSRPSAGRKTSPKCTPRRSVRFWRENARGRSSGTPSAVTSAAGQCSGLPGSEHPSCPQPGKPMEPTRGAIGPTTARTAAPA